MDNTRGGKEAGRSGESGRSLRSGKQAEKGGAALPEPGASDTQGQPAGSLPERYAITEREKDRVLTCVEAPTLAVRVERGFSVIASAARKYPPGSIFLDGAAQAEPFIDREKQVFNLDHHEGCARAFTLATCEQAMVLVRMGLDLRTRDWMIYAGEPDLDAVFAIWILLNHIRLTEDNPAIRQAVMPLVRLQGTIDAHGLEMQELAALPPKLRDDTFAKLERLRARELELKGSGQWQDVDFLGYTLEMLRDLDRLVYSSLDFQQTLEVQELAHATIADRWLVVACKSKVGIYELVPHLRRLHGDRLGIVVLQKDESTYTLRRLNQSLPVSLNSIYERLNLMDPAVAGGKRGDRWGGSEEIGGSPRRTGTELTAAQIVGICSAAYQKGGRISPITNVLLAIVASLAVLIGAVSVIALHGYLRRPFPALADVFVARSPIFAAVLGILSLLLLFLPGRRLREYGLRLPAQLEWLYLLAPAALAGLAGGQWFPAALHPRSMLADLTSWGDLINPLIFAAAAELLFRGTIHGILARVYSTQRAGGRWYLSWPVGISSALYAFWSLFPFQPVTLAAGLGTGLAVALFAVCCGMARERSGSLLAPIFIHFICLLIPALI